MKTLLANPEYSLYDANGNDHNTRWKHSIFDLLTTLIADVNQPVEERDRAADALKVYAVVEQERLDDGGSPEGDRVCAEQTTICIWEDPDRWEIRKAERSWLHNDPNYKGGVLRTGAYLKESTPGVAA
jgi:hypothetical protein